MRHAVVNGLIHLPASAVLFANKLTVHFQSQILSQFWDLASVEQVCIRPSRMAPHSVACVYGLGLNGQAC